MIKRIHKWWTRPSKFMREFYALPDAEQVRIKAVWKEQGDLDAMEVW